MRKLRFQVEAKGDLMRVKSLASYVLALALPAVAAATVNGGAPPPVQVNKDLTNLGPAAYDVAIVLAGQETITDWFDGHHSGPKVGWFDSRDVTQGANTIIHWQTFSDVDIDEADNNGQIDTNQTIHVGFSTADGDHKILDMYWTDPDGRRIPGSVVYDEDAHATYRGDRFTWTWANELAEAAPVSVGNIRYAVLSEPLPLAQLNSENAVLADALRPLDPGFVLAPGEQRAIELPVSVPAGSAVLTVYESSAPESGAVVVNYIQTLAK
jgi:hypothetical protein